MRHFAIIALLLALPVSAGNYYVDPAAAGAANGTSWADAWTSFATVNWVTLKGAANTLYISGGTSGRTYYENMVIRHDVYSESSRLTIRCGQDSSHTGAVSVVGKIQLGDESGNPAHFVTLDGSFNGTTNIFLTKTNNGATINTRYDSTTNNIYRYLDISTFDTADTQTHCIELSSYADNTEIDHCFIHNSAFKGIREGSGSGAAYGRISIHHNSFLANNDDDVAIDGGVDCYDNIFNGIGSDPATHPDGIQGVKGSWRIYNNVFHDHTQEIFIETTATNAANVLIYNNVFYDVDGSSTSPAMIFRVKLPTPAAHSWTNWIIANNTIVGMDMTAFRIGVDSGNTLEVHESLFVNNLFATNASNMLMNDGGEGTASWVAADFPYQFNILNQPESANWQGTAYSTIAALQAAQAVCVNNLNSAPTFTDAATQNYHLSVDSIGVGTATNLNAIFITDKDGVTRGAVWDIGAYEYVPSSASKHINRAVVGAMRVGP